MLKLFTIILAIVLCRGSRGPSEQVLSVGQQEMLFAPILQSTDEAVISKEINKNFWAGLGVDTIAGSNLSKTLLNILSFDHSKLLLAYPDIDLQNLEEELFKFLSNYQPETISALADSNKKDSPSKVNDNGFRRNLEDFLDSIIRKDLRTNKEQIPRGHYLSAEQVERVTERLQEKWRSRAAMSRSQPWKSASQVMESRPGKSIESKNRESENEETWYNAVSVIQGRIAKSMKFKIEFSNSLKRVSVDKILSLQLFTLSFIESLAVDPSKKFETYQHTIKSLIHVFGLLKKVDNLLVIGKYMSDGFWSAQYFNSDIFRRAGFHVVRILSNLAMMIEPDNDRALLNSAREIFFRFYRTEVYPEPTDEMKWLVQGLAHGLSGSIQTEVTRSKTVSNLTPMTVLVIDFLLLSRHMPSDFLPLTFYKLILQNIEYLAPEFGQKDLRTLAATKSLFLKTNSLIPNHFELYTDLYETTIAMVAHWGVIDAQIKKAEEESKSKGIPPRGIPEADVKISKSQNFWAKWDRFINQGHLVFLDSKDGKDIGGSFLTMTPWPDTKYFPLSVAQNYFFYQALMLLTGLEDQIPIRFVFHEFKSTDHWLIHRFMMERPVKALFHPLQMRVWPKKGYNYGVFSGSEIHGKVFSAIVEEQRVKEEFLRQVKFD